jgi:hypothetical protein
MFIYASVYITIKYKWPSVGIALNHTFLIVGIKINFNVYQSVKQ